MVKDQPGKLEFAGRISNILKSKDKNLSWLAAETGIGLTTLSEYNRGAAPRIDKALLIAEALGVDVTSLFGGPAGTIPIPINWDAGASAEAKLDPGVVELDEIDLRYGMGGSYIDGPVSAAKRQFSREWLHQITRAAPEHLFWAQGDGDSMEPTIRSQDVILIDRSQQTPLMGDGVWAIAWGDVGMIKRLRPMPDGTLELHSDNQLVRPATAVDGEVHIIGRVVAVVKRL